MSYEAWAKKLETLRTRLQAGYQVWWSREPLHKEPYKDVEPKWHLFAGRAAVEGKPGSFYWTASCGYRWSALEALLTVPRLKLGKAKPTKAQQCDKCVRSAK